MKSEVKPYRCDVCNRPKDPANGWLMIKPIRDGFSIQLWDDREADHDDMSHYCGLNCAIKAHSQMLSDMYYQHAASLLPSVEPIRLNAEVEAYDKLLDPNRTGFYIS